LEGSPVTYLNRPTVVRTSVSLIDETRLEFVSRVEASITPVKILQMQPVTCETANDGRTRKLV
jgi:hypothetical protein